MIESQRTLRKKPTKKPAFPTKPPKRKSIWGILQKVLTSHCTGRPTLLVPFYDYLQALHWRYWHITSYPHISPSSDDCYYNIFNTLHYTIHPLAYSRLILSSLHSTHFFTCLLGWRSWRDWGHKDQHYTGVGRNRSKIVESVMQFLSVEAGNGVLWALG